MDQELIIGVITFIIGGGGLIYVIVNNCCVRIFKSPKIADANQITQMVEKDNEDRNLLSANNQTDKPKICDNIVRNNENNPNKFTTDELKQDKQLTQLKQYRVAFKLHIAIDFGTDGCGIAFAHEDEKTGEKVTIYNKWRGARNTNKRKTKTQLILNKQNRVSCFGNAACEVYCNTSKEGQKEQKFLARFKMALYENAGRSMDDEKTEDKIDTAEYLYASNGERVKSSIVFIAALQEIQKLAKEFIPRNILKAGQTIKDEEIQWILTVPAIWSESAKNKMRNWTIKAGLVDESIMDQCVIVYEPDCASLSIQKTATDDFAKRARHKGFSKGEKYILIDAGGGTVDVACHKVLEDECVEEIVYPTGNKCGSTYIDDSFVDLLKAMFTQKWIDSYQKRSPANYVELISNFRKSKELFYKKKNDNNHNASHCIELPDDFMSFLEQECRKINSCSETIVEKFVVGKNIQYFKQLFFEDRKFDDDDDKEDSLLGLIKKKADEDDEDEFDEDECVWIYYLEMSSKVWKCLFDSKINPIISHVKNLLKKDELKDCKYLGLVGGFSESKYFQFRMKETFSEESRHSTYKLTVIIPKKPMLCVVEGAAWMGLTKGYIRARRLKQTYGVSVNVPRMSAKDKMGISDEYINNNLTKNGNVKNCFRIIAQKNQRIEMDEIRTNEFTTKGKQVSKIPILCSDEKYAKIKSDGTVLATLVVPNDTKDEKVVTEFHFGGTTLKVYAYPKSNPNLKQQVNIKYQS